MLGALTKIMDMISTRAMEKAIDDSLGKADDINKQAFNRGRALIK
jgi:Pyruvate/2-oxoacid:ferredoxin oxidoreductase gamma subunit